MSTAIWALAARRYLPSPCPRYLPALARYPQHSPDVDDSLDDEGGDEGDEGGYDEGDEGGYDEGCDETATMMVPARTTLTYRSYKFFVFRRPTMECPLTPTTTSAP